MEDYLLPLDSTTLSKRKRDTSNKASDSDLEEEVPIPISTSLFIATVII